ncbi:hypothetical protein WMF37_04980 [Sorangium sp. So ce291]|uniref:hypothetical protein n=1 Tax=Sorangium sp. So ce291 TaxID=3133294 RepID=UPI003F603583
MSNRGYRIEAIGALVVFTAGCEALVDFGPAQLRPPTCSDGADSSPPDGAILWLCSDVGLTADAAHLSWEDQITKQHAISSDETGAGSVPTVVSSSSGFSGHDAVRFDGTNNRVLLPPVDASFQDGFTAALVVRDLGTDAWDGVLFLGRQDQADTQAYNDVIAIGQEYVSNHIRFTVQKRYNPLDWSDGIVQSYGGISTLAPSAEILLVQQRPEDGTVWFYHNGKIVAKVWGDAPLPPNTLRDASYLGWLPTGGFTGDIAEVLLYEHALEYEERIAIQRYLATKYGVTLASPCADGCPEVLARDQGIPTYIASRGARIAWTNWESGDVMTIDDVTAEVVSPKRVFGGDVTSDHPTGPALDGTHVYWGDQINIHRASVSGMNHVSQSAGGDVQNVALDDTTAYASLGEAHGIASISKSAWDKASMAAGNEKIKYVAVDGGFVYWSQLTDDTATTAVYRTPKATSIDPTMKELVANTTDPGQIIFDDRYVYIASFDGVRRVDKATPESEMVLVQGIDVGGIAVDGAYLYYTDSMGGTVNRVPIEGGSATVIVDGQAWPFGIVVVGDYLIWANRDGTIVRFKKPS